MFNVKNNSTPVFLQRKFCFTSDVYHTKSSLVTLTILDLLKITKFAILSQRPCLSKKILNNDTEAIMSSSFLKGNIKKSLKI